MHTVAQLSIQQGRDSEGSFVRHRKLWVPEKGERRKDEDRIDQADVHGRQGWETISVALVEQTLEQSFPGCREAGECCSKPDLRTREQH